MKVDRLLLALVVLSCSLAAFSQTSPVITDAWDVSFTLSDNTTTRRLTYISFSNGTGSFRFIVPRTTVPSTAISPAVWSGRVPGYTSFTSEVRLPISNCCTEPGTLIFKGIHVAGSHFMTGRVIFVSDAFDATNPRGHVVKTGSFIAEPLPVAALKQRRR
jgi:hypothetical protein